MMKDFIIFIIIIYFLLFIIIFIFFFVLAFSYILFHFAVVCEELQCDDEGFYFGRPRPLGVHCVPGGAALHDAHHRPHAHRRGERHHETRAHLHFGM